MVGLGHGARVHVPALRSLRGVEVVALVGRDLKKTRAAAQELGIRYAGTSLAEVSRSAAIDLVTLAVPPGEQTDVAHAIFEHKLPAFLEKPLGANLEQAQNLVSEFRGIPHALGFQFGELEAFIEARRLLKEGVCGEIRCVDVRWHTESYAQNRKQWSWKTDAERGGGVLSLNGSHLLYLAEWLLGPCTSVSARLHSNATQTFAPAERCAADDRAQMILHHASEVELTIDLSNARPGENIHRWVFHGSDARLTLENEGADYMGAFQLQLHRVGHKAEVLSTAGGTEGDGRIEPTARLLQRLIDQMRGGQPCVPNAACGLRVQELMQAVRASAVSGCLSAV